MREGDRERNEGEGGLLTTDTHAHVHARNMASPLPHYYYSHIYASGKMAETGGAYVQIQI